MADVQSKELLKDKSEYYDDSNWIYVQNIMAAEMKTNTHCLFETFEEARSHIESGAFNHCEPGPYRILEVFSVQVDSTEI